MEFLISPLNVVWMRFLVAFIAAFDHVTVGLGIQLMGYTYALLAHAFGTVEAGGRLRDAALATSPEGRGLGCFNRVCHRLSTGSDGSGAAAGGAERTSAGVKTLGGASGGHDDPSRGRGDAPWGEDSKLDWTKIFCLTRTGGPIMIMATLGPEPHIAAVLRFEPPILVGTELIIDN